MLAGYCELTKPAVAITGWHFNGYDMPYLKNRLKVYGMDMSRASVKGTVDWKKNPTHTFIEDYMEIFKDKAHWLIENCESFKLDYVAKHIVGLGKLPKPQSIDKPLNSDGSINYMGLKELRKHDLNRFLAYNVIDTALVQLIHRAINTMASVGLLASLSFTTLKECLSPVSHSTGIMNKYFLDTQPNTVVALADRPEKRKYPGAFVKEPSRNFARNLACYDYSSLYPSLIKTHNISADNFIRKLNPAVDDIASFMGDPQYTVTSTGSLYKNDRDYFYKIVESELYDARKSWQLTSVKMQQICVNPLEAELTRRGINKKDRYTF
jgi:DNA polymerase elongation subunit (family B)